MSNKYDILEKAIELSLKMGWANFELADLAKEYNLKLDEIYEHFPNKASIIETLIDKVNKETLSKIEKEDLHENSRDILLEIILIRIELMEPYKEFIRMVMSSVVFDPILAIKEYPKIYETARWFLTTAGYNISGPFESLRIVGFTALFAMKLMKFWLSLDNTPEDRDRLLKRIDETLIECEKLNII